MKSTLQLRTPLANTSPFNPPLAPEPDRSTRMAFYFFMTTLVLALVYSLLLPFFI